MAHSELLQLLELLFFAFFSSYHTWFLKYFVPSHKYGLIARMKTTLELPDDLFRSVKARAAQEGISLKEYVASALRQKLGQLPEPAGEKRWRKHFGSLAHLRKETRRIERIIEQEFETIDVDAWK